MSLKIYRSWILQTIWFLGFLLYHYCLSNKPASLSVLKPLGKTPTNYHTMNYIFSLRIASLYDIVLHSLLCALKLDFLTISGTVIFLPRSPLLLMLHRAKNMSRNEEQHLHTKDKEQILQFAVFNLMILWGLTKHIWTWKRQTFSPRRNKRINDLEFFLMKSKNLVIKMHTELFWTLINSFKNEAVKALQCFHCSLQCPEKG